MHIRLSERRQPGKATYYVFPTLEHSEKAKTVKTVKRSVEES